MANQCQKCDESPNAFLVRLSHEKLATTTTTESETTPEYDAMSCIWQAFVAVVRDSSAWRTEESKFELGVEQVTYLT
jgi:hypothetical protein